MTHYLELARLSDAPDFIDGREGLGETLPTKLLEFDSCAQLNSSQFIRLSGELEDSFPVLSVEQVQLLIDLCLFANISEESFLSVSKDQWLRTKIVFDNALLCTEASDAKHSGSSITVHSVVMPCHPYWQTLQAVRDKAVLASKRLYFPSTFLEAARSEDKPLVEILSERKEREKQCAIAKRLQERDEEISKPSSRPFWRIRPGDVKLENLSLGQGSQAKVGKVSWRGGIFVSKTFNNESEFDTELDVVRRLSHPHIVYSFGVSISPVEKRHSLLMELLDRDLYDLIEDKVRLNGTSTPPFSPLESIDILLQIAKAITHIHGLAEPVIHGDLKPGNILVSECEILDDVRQYLVKVADFGSARILKRNSSSTFKPGAATTKYAAPEILKARGQKNPDIEFPKKIDVYGFGAAAFKILTGLEPYEGFLHYEGVSNPKNGVIAGKLRPRLREACERPNFWNDEDLMALVESCWHHEPSKRPEFSDVTDELERIRNNLDRSPVNGAHIPQTNAVDDGPQNSQDGADLLPPAQEIAVNGGPQNPRIKASAFAPPEANAINGTPQGGVDVLPPTHEIAVNGGPQNQNIGTHASPWPRENATATTVDGAPEVCGKKKPKKGLLMRIFPCAKVLSCALVSPGNVME